MRLPGAPGRRLLLQVAAVAAVVAAVLVIRPGVPRPPRPVPSAPAVAASQTPGDTGKLYVTPSLSAADLGNAVRVAERFTAAWARPELGAQTWWRGVAAYAEPGYAALLRTVEPSNVPAHRVTGAGRSVRVDGGVVVVDVPTDAGTCRVTVTAAAGTGTWRVSTHELSTGGPR
jgi:hypothetical protein